MSAYKAATGVYDESKNWAVSAEHTTADLIAAFLREGGINPDDALSIADGGKHWAFTTDPGLSVILRLYQGEAGQSFFILEVALTKVPAEIEAQVLKWIGLMNRRFYDPFRLALDEKGSVFALIRCRADGMTEDYFQEMLQELIPFSRETLRRLQVEFPSLRPFCRVE